MFQNHRALAGALIVVAAAACFGTLGPVSRLAYGAGVSPLGFTTWRALLGGLLMVALIGSRARRWRRHGAVGARRLELRNLAIATAAGFVLNLAIFMAFSRVSVAIALLGFYTYPAMVTVADSIVHREPLDRTRLVALGLALAGMVLVVAGQLDPSGAIAFDVVGFGLALLAAASQTVYITVSRHGFPSFGGDQAVAVVLLVGAAGYAVTAVVAGSAADLGYPVTRVGVWPLLLFAGIVGGGFPGLLFLTGVRWIGGTRTSILALFEPVTGVVLAAILLGEALRPIQVVGGALVLGAAAVLQRSREETPHEAPNEPSLPAVV